MAKSVELGPIKSPPARAMFSGNGLATSPSIVGRSGSSEPRLRTTGAAVGGGDDGGLGGGVAKLDVGCGVATGPVVESVAVHAPSIRTQTSITVNRVPMVTTVPVSRCRLYGNVGQG
jgi:hypothetical protein